MSNTEAQNTDSPSRINPETGSPVSSKVNAKSSDKREPLPSDYEGLMHQYKLSRPEAEQLWADTDGNPTKEAAEKISSARTVRKPVYAEVNDPNAIPGGGKTSDALDGVAAPDSSVTIPAGEGTNLVNEVGVKSEDVGGESKENPSDPNPNLENALEGEGDGATGVQGANVASASTDDDSDNQGSVGSNYDPADDAN